MKNIFFLKFLFFIIMINYSSEVFFILEPFDTRCISKDFLARSSFTGVYFISGEKEESNKAYITDKDNHVIWSLVNQKNGSFNLYVESDGIFSLCFESTTNIQMTVSFDLFDDKKEDQLISVQNIENLNTVIFSIRKKMDIIHSNVKNSSIRRKTHSEISQTINSKITFYTIVKILFLVAFSVFQILMLTSIVGTVKVQNKIEIKDSAEKNDRGYSNNFKETPSVVL